MLWKKSANGFLRSLNRPDIIYKTRKQVETLRVANRIGMEVLVRLREAAKPGVTTLELDDLAMAECRKHRVKPAFLGLYGFPNALCISLNDEIVHGIPSPRRVLKEGDLVSLDFGVVYQDMYSDAAITLGVEPLSSAARELMRITEESLYRGIAQAKAGNRIRDLSTAVQNHAESHGFAVVREFVGHGVGVGPHESPQIPNFADGWSRNQVNCRLRPGMTLALEPMITNGDWQVVILEDGWTAKTKDGSLAAHFEHSILVTEDGPEILSKLGE